MRDIDAIIKKLRRLDGDAADYVQQQYDAGYITTYQIVNTRDAITYLFTWSEQPQGREYWDNLYSLYRELPNLTPKGNEL
jgi:hypothetical protein